MTTVNPFFPCCFLQLISVLTLVLTVGNSASAQGNLPPDAKVYTYAEQMPQLPGGGGFAALLAAVQQQVVSPPRALRDGITGSAFVALIVGPDGSIAKTYIVRSLRPDCDSAVIAAVRLLPLLLPARQNGKPVYASFTLPIRFLPASAPVGR